MAFSAQLGSYASTEATSTATTAITVEVFGPPSITRPRDHPQRPVAGVHLLAWRARETWTHGRIHYIWSLFSCPCSAFLLLFWLRIDLCFDVCPTLLVLPVLTACPVTTVYPFVHFLARLLAPSRSASAPRTRLSLPLVRTRTRRRSTLCSMSFPCLAHRTSWTPHVCRLFRIPTSAWASTERHPALGFAPLQTRHPPPLSPF